MTSRQFRIQPETEAWIAQHYPGVFTALHYGNHYSGALVGGVDAVIGVGWSLLTYA